MWCPGRALRFEPEPGRRTSSPRPLDLILLQLLAGSSGARSTQCPFLEDSIYWTPLGGKGCLCLIHLWEEGLRKRLGDQGMRNLYMHARDSLIRHLNFHCSAEKRGRGCQAPRPQPLIGSALCSAVSPATYPRFPERYQALPESLTSPRGNAR